MTRLALGPLAPAAALLLAVAPVLVPGQPAAAFVVAVVVVVTAGVVDALLAVPPRALQVDRESPDVVTLGESARVGLRLRRPEGRTARLRLHDAASPSLDLEPSRHRVTMRDRSMTVYATVTPRRRGARGLGAVTVRSLGPLRLAGRQAARPAAATLRIHPRLPGRAEAELRLRRAQLLAAGERPVRARGGASTFDSLRDYHPDDEFRRINWRATARRGAPVTNVYRQERNQEVAILLDAGRTMATRVGDAPRLEAAIDAAVALATLAGRIGDRVGALAFDRTVRAAAASRAGRDQGRRILDTLYDVEPRLPAAAYPVAFAALLARQRRRALLALLTDLEEPAALEPLFRTAPMLVSRHLLIVGAVRDPALDDLARGRPQDSRDVYRAAAAARRLHGRETSARRLRALGATVVDAPPGGLAGRLVDAYLSVKERGAL